jgi:anti-sigma factor RsiW
MRDCESIRQSIGRWFDGELNPTESESVRAHVADCAQCSEARRQLEKIQLALKGALLSEAQKIEFLPFWRAVQLRIAEKRTWYQDAVEWARDVFPVSRAAWAVPAVIALLLVVLSLESYFPGWRWGGARNNFATVESIDAYERNVALLRENESKTTVIWLYQDQEGDNETTDDSAKSAPAF